MLHTKFHGNRLADSGEDFFKVFTIYGHGGHLGYVTSITLKKFHFLVPESFHTKFSSLAAIVSEKSTVFTFSHIVTSPIIGQGPA